MKIVGLTREQLQKDVNEAGSSLALGRIQAAPSPAPAHTQTHAETHTQNQHSHAICSCSPSLLLQDLQEKTAQLCKINRESGWERAVFLIEAAEKRGKIIMKSYNEVHLSLPHLHAAG